MIHLVFCSNTFPAFLCEDKKVPTVLLSTTRHSPLDLERALLCLGEDVGVADDPEEGEESEAAGEDRAVELDTPEAGGEGRTPQ